MRRSGVRGSLRRQIGFASHTSTAVMRSKPPGLHLAVIYLWKGPCALRPSLLGSHTQPSQSLKITKTLHDTSLNLASVRAWGEIAMKRQTLQALLKVAILASAAQIVMPARAQSPRPPVQSGAMQLATGQFITPTFMRGAVQQFLNPGLPAYPNFVAGEAVRSQLSPDGTTLAVITAGQNSLDKPNGSLDTPTRPSTSSSIMWQARARPSPFSRK